MIYRNRGGAPTPSSFNDGLSFSNINSYDLELIDGKSPTLLIQ